MLYTVAVNGFAQNPDIKRIYHWYFGDNAGIDFSGGSSQADTNGAMNAIEGFATISDTAGPLFDRKPRASHSLLLPPQTASLQLERS